MADQSSQQQVKKPLHHHNHLDMDELSVTLIERRKRLHELASEINQWEDEETKRLAHATAALMNQSPSTNTTMNNTTTTPFAVSPSPRLGGLRQTSPSPHHYHLTPTNNNKENRTPTNSVGKPAASAVTPGSNEILSVAKRILTKKQSSSEPTALSQPSQTVKSIASKFETLTTSGDESSVVVQEKLTPRSIIQKFEKMASGGSAHSALSSVHKKPSENNIHKVLGLSNQLNNVTTPKHWIRPQQHRDEDNNEEDEKTDEKSEESSNKPRSIIEKFESLMHQQQHHNQAPKPMIQSTRSQANGPSPASTHASNSTSLTYVSSVMEAVNCGTNEYCDYDGGDTNRRFDEEGNETSLFEDDDDQVSDEDNTRVRRKRSHQEDDKDDRVSVASTFTNTTDTNRESSSYSISGSSYTAEMMNQDEFDDVDEDDYDSIDDDEMLDSTANTNNITSSQAQETDVETTITTASTSENQSYVSSIDETTVQQQTQQQPLMSLKDYRKQTKTFRSGCGRRRSSIMPAQNSNNVSHSKPQAPNSRDRKKSHLATIGENNGSGEATPDNSPNNTRYMERIKDLEELIKQEDNTIRQTKDAIECCLNDPQFTGSSQHIECNRLLLISCQKKQAFMTEANRLRSLLNSKQASSSDISPYDLSAVLVVSDIQIPVKESFLNKVKSGEDKRQFNFICIIRNGIQVIQTQLVSTQDVLKNNEKSLIFPNRIAVSNVDINFRLKVDIYEMEIQPKDQQPTKRGKHSSLHQSKFFVSPFKSSNFSQVIHNTLGGGHSSSVHHHGSSKDAASIGAKTSQFIHIDTVEITKKDLHTGNNLKFKLNLSSSSIPLIGVLSLSVRCVPSKSIELKGFMTLFEEDASGLGTWDRRWCFLNNLSISYWKYPEDEYRSGPLGTILLTMCVSDAVSILPRDLCARKHTIELLVCVPPDEASASLQQTSDNIDLSKCKRYRLSADTKEQANDWITNINHALANLRLWNPKAMKPIKK